MTTSYWPWRDPSRKFPPYKRKGLYSILENVVPLVRWCESELVRLNGIYLHVKLRGSPFVYEFWFTGQDEGEIARLYLLFANKAALSNPFDRLWPEAMKLWQKLGSQALSPQQLKELSANGDRCLAHAGEGFEILALLCALGVEPQPNYRGYTAEQIVEAYGLAQEYGITFAEAIAA